MCIAFLQKALNHQAPCDDSTARKLEFEFHPAGYLTLLEVVQIMKNILGQIINYKKV